MGRLWPAGPAVPVGASRSSARMRQAPEGGGREVRRHAWEQNAALGGRDKMAAVDVNN